MFPLWAARTCFSSFGRVIAGKRVGPVQQAGEARVWVTEVGAACLHRQGVEEELRVSILSEIMRCGCNKRLYLIVKSPYKMLLKNCPPFRLYVVLAMWMAAQFQNNLYSTHTQRWRRCQTTMGGNLTGERDFPFPPWRHQYACFGTFCCVDGN